MKNLVFCLFVVIFAACTSSNVKEIVMPYQEADFEREINGKSTRMFTLKNKNGMVVTLTNYGAKIISIYAPGRDGDLADVVLGFNSLEDYQKYGASHGAIVGPFANRISGGSFKIGENTYNLPLNNGENTIHSGPESWYRKVWDYHQEDNSVVFSIESADGEFGFPGNRKANVTYTLTADNELRIDYEITTDKPTHVNPTNHTYFNLRGEGNGDILDHILVINAEKVTPVKDNSMIPSGEFEDIKGTALDFSVPHSMGERIDSGHPQLILGKGYDFNYVLNKEPGRLEFAASVYESESGRYMEVFTTEPGIQLYTGNHLSGRETGKSGKPYDSRTGFCLETQHFPDSPNQPQFPSTLLNPGDVYKSTTLFAFSVK